jgi:plasmid maintenance system antidote protein VapI
MTKMHNPPHPGEVLKELCLDPLGVTVTEAARSLGGEPEDTVQHPERTSWHQP